VSALIVRDGRALALETEGGHVSFAANSPIETAILEQLLHWYPRVSNERLVSGGGLVNIHRALGAISGQASDPVRPSDVTAGARAGDARCVQAVEVFCSIFGSVAGDLVLTLGAWDGVFLTGGLVPILLPELQRSGFRSRFESKGRFSTAMAKVPAMAVIHPHAGLLGAAAFAQQDALQAASVPDERNSNARLVRDTLLVGHAAHARFEPMTGTDVDFDESVALANRASTHSSVVVLGMGPDGHTASLFPGMHNLGEALASPSHYVGVDASGCPGAQGWNKRISLTPAGMASASCRLLLIRGPQKLDLLQTALSGDDMQELPVRAALHLPGSPLQVHWCP